MSGAPGIPSNYYVQTANQQILVSWSQTPGATSYVIQRSQDNITYATVSTISGSPLASQYLDTSALLGTQYWYQASAVNVNGASAYTTPQSAVATPTAEKCLSQIRLAAMQRADRVNSNFVTLPEWTSYINQSLFELYDLLITVYEDYYIASPIQFVADGSTFLYPLPNGSNTFQDGLNPSNTVTPRPFYKLSGVDLALNNASNAFVTVNRFNFADRNRFVYPNSASTIYGVFNLQYRIMGNNLEFIPTPSASQTIRLWYIPRIKELLLDTDTTDVSISGWIEYVIVKAAYYALTKEESDTTQLIMQLAALQKRIEETAANRDAGMPDKVSDTASGWGQGWNGGSNGSIGGF